MKIDLNMEKCFVSETITVPYLNVIIMAWLITASYVIFGFFYIVKEMAIFMITLQRIRTGENI